MSEFSEFDATVKKILSVPRAELIRREKAWKAARKRKKRARTSPASRASNGKD